MNSKRIAIIGDGGWGTALALVLSNNGHQVTVWGPFEEQVAAIRDAGENKVFLPGVPLPDAIRWTADRQLAVQGADVVILAIPTRFYAEVAQSFAALLPRSAHVVSVAKGLEAQTHRRMTEVARDAFGGIAVAALSGPSHAEEVARGVPTAVVLAGDAASAEALQEILTTRRFRIYTSPDVIGVELGGAMKNVIAVAVGVSDGIGFGDNTRAALISRGLAEMTRVGVAMGASEATFSGLSGMGDLIVTCTSRHSRNRGVGERLGKGEKIAAITASMKQVAEGVWNCAGIRELADAKGVETPITDEVYNIIHEGKEPQEAVESLLSRSFRPE